MRTPILALIFLLPIAAMAQATVSVCGDLAGFPPYTYEDPQHKGQIIGATVDMVTAALQKTGRTPRFTLLPWLRCLESAETGTQHAMVLDATFNNERAQKYLISDPVYEIHSALYYDVKKFPKPPEVKSVADLQKYKYCGVHGYNYSMYPIPSSQWDMSAKNEINRFEMLKADRCDFAVADLEPLQGFVNLGQINIAGLATIPVPDFNSKKYYVLISKNGDGPELLKAFNSGMKQLRADGTYKKILTRYGI